MAIPTFTREQKQQIIESYLSGSFENQNALAAHYGVKVGTFQYWLAKYRKNELVFTDNGIHAKKTRTNPNGMSTEEYIAYLERQHKLDQAKLQESEADVETLKKSVAILIGKDKGQ